MLNIRKLRDVRASLDDLNGQEVVVAGWIKNLRNSKNFSFMIINDGSVFDGAQVVLEPQFVDNYDDVVKLGVGSAVIATGILEATPDAKQPYEIKGRKVHIEGASDSTYPLQKKTSYIRVPAYHSPLKTTYQYIQCCF